MSTGYVPPAQSVDAVNPSPHAAAFQAGAIPSWKGLKIGGEKTPLLEFIGTLVKWSTEVDNFQNVNILIFYQGLQVLDSTTPYPSSEGMLTIKYSDSQNSGWGKAGASYAKANGLDIEQMELDMLKGQVHHMYLKTDEQYGINRQTNETMVGTVWKCIQVAPSAGYNPVLAKAQFIAAEGGQAPAPVPVAVTPVVVAPVVAAPVVSTPAIASAHDRALELLHGKDIATFFSDALNDDVIKADNELVQNIVNRSFIATEVQSNRVTENPDGTYTVAGM